MGLEHLYDILPQPLSAYDPDDPPDLERMFQQPSTDLALALGEQGRFSMKTQGQAQSLLAHEQFLSWMSRSHPSLILVDANIRESDLDNISAISVLCSTLVTSLIQAYPDAVVVHFFCGMHDFLEDAWYGPNGLVRSVIMQLLMKLQSTDPKMRTWSLDFIDDRQFLENLEQHCLDDLCKALHALLNEFQPDTHVYCIIDSVSCFDVSRLLEDLGVVLECLRQIVDDRKLRPVFKVLLTNPGESTFEMKNMTPFRENPARLISLNPYNLVPGEITGRAVDSHLLRAPSPSMRRTPSPFGRFRTPSPAVSVRKRIAEPVPVVREVFYDYEGDSDDDPPYWDHVETF